LEVFFLFFLFFFFIFIIGTILKDEDTISDAGIENGNMIFVVPKKKKNINISIIGV
jgi:hypothetical protein